MGAYNASLDYWRSDLAKLLSNMDNQDLFQLWQRYKLEKNNENRNILFHHYSAWMRKITSIQFSRYGTQQIEWADCVQNASIALIDSIERFDIDRGVPFEGFAYTRVKGAIINGINHSQKDKVALQGIAGAEKEFLEGVHLSSDPDDMFDSFVDSILDLAFCKILNMNSYRLNTVSANPLDIYLSISEEEAIINSIELLPPDLKYVINAHYNHFFPFTEIAEQMKLSRSRVSQLHRAALRELRKLYELN